MRTCSMCQLNETQTKFTKKNCYCNKCRWIREKALGKSNRVKADWRAANRDKERASRRSQWQRDRLKPTCRYSRSKAAAKKRGIGWLLTLEEFTKFDQLPCHYCHQPFESVGIGLDRIDNDGVYEVSNCLPCCRICNLIRNRLLTVEQMEFMMLAKAAFDELTSG